ncbi:MAG: pirin family protein [Synechococcus sp.]
MHTRSLLLRPASERFHSQQPWLDSWHSFSFAGHHHPDWMGFGPLRVINDDTIAPGKGFGMHPHRDMDIITVMVEGQLNHRDSLGNSGSLQAGDVQRMTAGSGIVHSEINGGTIPCRLLQIWLAPTEANLAPSYDQRSVRLDPQWTPLIAPDQAGVMAITRPVRLWRAQPRKGQTLQWPAKVPPVGWLQVIGGQLNLGSEHADNTLLHRGDGVGFRNSDAIHSLTSQSERSDVLLFGLA